MLQFERYRVIDSVGFTASVRLVWLVADDPNSAGRNLFLIVKTNLTQNRTGLAYSSIVNNAIAYEEKTTAITADEVLGAKRERSSPQLDAAIE